MSNDELPLDPGASVEMRPGDTLVVRLRSDSTREHFKMIREAFAERMPDTKIFVVTAEQLAVIRHD